MSIASEIAEEEAYKVEQQHKETLERVQSELADALESKEALSKQVAKLTDENANLRRSMDKFYSKIHICCEKLTIGNSGMVGFRVFAATHNKAAALDMTAGDKKFMVELHQLELEKGEWRKPQGV